MAIHQYTIDTRDISTALNELQVLCQELNGFSAPIDFDRGRGRHNDPEQAALSRDLLRATELARMVASEFSMHYWSLKGYQDPRFDPES